MNGKKIFYFLIIILIVIVCFSIFKDKASYNDKNQNQIESKKNRYYTHKY